MSKVFDITPINRIIHLHKDNLTIDRDRYIVSVQSRVLNALKRGINFDATIDRSENFLRKRVNSKISLVVFYIDLVNSTVMSNLLPIDKLATIIQTFAQESTFIVNSFNGYVLKYVGDAVISYFPTERNYYLASDNAIECSISMLKIIKEGINPILSDYGYPELQAKIGVDVGEHAVIKYGKGDKAHVDIIGYPISMAAKITEQAKPNEILISKNVYTLLHPRLRSKFEARDSSRLIYYTDSKGDAYAIYGMRV